MRKSRETFVPDQATLALVNRISESVAPHFTAHSDWFDSYARDHAERIALDIMLAKENLRQGMRILEYGSVPLLFTGALSAQGYNVEGVDIAPERFAAAINALDLRVTKANVETDTLPFADNTFDAVIFNEIFEHLRINPIFTLRECTRVMKPGGILILSTPNLKSLRGMAKFLLKDIGYSCANNIYDEYLKLETLGHMGHVREYTSKEVVQFLAHFDLDVENVVYRGGKRDGLVRLLYRLIYSWSPNFSIIARKQPQS